MDQLVAVPITSHYWVYVHNAIFLAETAFGFLEKSACGKDDEDVVVSKVKWYGEGISVEEEQAEIDAYLAGYVAPSDPDPECDRVHYRTVFRSGRVFGFDESSTRKYGGEYCDFNISDHLVRKYIIKQ